MRSSTTETQNGAGDGASEGRIQQALSRGGLVDITTSGRWSGQRRRIEIVFHNIGGRLYISGIPRRERRSWIANLEANPHLDFHLKGSVEADLPATARIIDDEGERREILHHVARNWKRSDVEVMVRYSPLIEVTIDNPDSRRPSA